VAGSVSGNLELIDFDQGGELYEAWAAKIAPELLAKLVIETSQSAGRHVIYRGQESVNGNLKLAQRMQNDAVTTLIETRGQGGLFLCAPTTGYQIVQGEMDALPILTEQERETLLIAAWQLNEHWAQPGTSQTDLNTSQATVRSEAKDREQSPVAARDRSEAEGWEQSPVAARDHDRGWDRPGDDFNAQGDVVALLTKHGWQPVGVHSDGNQHWTRPGKIRGSSATLKDNIFYVFSSNAHPFQPNGAYSPFAVLAMLEHGGDFEAAARELGQQGYGNDLSMPSANSDVDLSRLITTPGEPKEPSAIEPGPIPEHLFHVPGFVTQVMNFTLSAAPYPNQVLAFCGAMALQSFLTARKVRTSGDLRSNIYLLALASSGTGKEFPRKVNSHILYKVGLAGSLGDKFASGEGIQDALVRTGAMLFQNDEMDGVLRQINLDQENRRESIPNILLTLFTSASDIYPIRVKAGQKEAIHVDQPHLTLFGTATPQHFYQSLNMRMLTNGFFARMMIVDVGQRGVGQTPGSPRDIPQKVIDVAKWWSEYQPGTGNLQGFHPEPRVVKFTSEAEAAVEQLRILTEAEYDHAQSVNDEVGRTAWSRTCENAKKLALIYACSENHQDSLIGLPAIQWATEFAMHQTRRQLYLAATYVAENPFHADCLKMLHRMRKVKKPMSRTDLMRFMHIKASELDQIISTLMQQEDIEPVTILSNTKNGRGYQVV